MPDVDLLVVEKHAIHGLDGGIGSFPCLIMNETVSFRPTDFISGDLAGQDVAKSRKCIMKSLVENLIHDNHYMLILRSHLVVDLFVQVFDKNVALPGLAEGGITLGPHDPATVKVRKERMTRNEGSITMRGFLSTNS